jgi:SAM-dependent methyltransferase
MAAGDGVNDQDMRAKQSSDPAHGSSPDLEADAAEEGEAKTAARRARKRARLTLRIPDDDIVRPEPSAVTHIETAETEEVPVANAQTEEVPSVRDPGPISAAPMIMLGEVTGPDAERLVKASSRPPPALVPSDVPPRIPSPPPEPSALDEEKTPLMPSVVARSDAPPPERERAHSEPEERPPSSEEIEVAVDDDAPAPRDTQVSAEASPPASPSGRDTEVGLPPMEAQAESEEELDVDDDVTTSAPPVRARSEPPPPPRPRSEPPPARVLSEPPKPKPGSDPPLKHLSEPPRPMAQAILDTEETEESMPIESDRESDLPIEPEDMVAIESSPKPVSGQVPAVRHATPPPARKPSGVPSTPRMAVAPPARAPLVIVPSHATTPSPLAPHTVTESTAQRRRGRPWWEELFNDDFIRTMSKITDDQIAHEVDFIEDSLGVAKGGAVLDLACGTGRHAIELSRRGYQVVGYDLSLSMLARAADEAQDRDQKLNFVHGDMREMTFDETFDGVYCWNTSFGFFEEDKNATVITKVHRALRSGGQFLLDVCNRDYVAQQSPSLVWFEGEACICMDEMQVDFITSRMKVKRTMMFDDGRTREIDYQIRIYSLHELGKLLHDHGFRVAEVSGNCATPGVFFGTASPRTLILAEKR